MGNYVRACFCVDHLVQAAQFNDLFEALESLECKYNFWTIGHISGHLLLSNQTVSVKEHGLGHDASPERLQQIAGWLAVPSSLRVELGWSIGNKLYSARVMQAWHSENERRFISLDIEEKAFFPKKAIKFIPQNDVVFENFKQAVIQVIIHIDPTAGVIDYEADLDCEMLTQYGSLVSWGNYFRSSALSQWSSNDLSILLESVDESFQINKLGMLTFIHPLVVNQAWTSRHERVRTLLQRNPIQGSTRSTIS